MRFVGGTRLKPSRIESFRVAALCVTLFGCFVPSLALAQIDTTLREYFPMHMGDYWEYMDDDITPFLHYYVSIAGDTVMPNAQTYRKFRWVRFDYPNNPYYAFYRIDDSMRVYVYSYEPSCSQWSEYLVYDLAPPDRSIWPVCLDFMPGGQVEYVGLFSTQEDYFPYLALDTLSKFYTSVTIDSASGDTLWNSGFVYGYAKNWLAQGIGLARTQSEAAPLIHLRGAIINGRQYGTITSAEEAGWNEATPNWFQLGQNFPNPFNSSTQIRYKIPHTSEVLIEIYNMLGQRISTLVHSTHNQGSYLITFNASTLPTSVYVCRLRADRTSLTRKMVLVK